MNYVKHFNINGIETKQVACIELQGPPNAATEGAVGVLGIDITSPSHDVYKCVAVNGSIYTWELLSSGMSILCSSDKGEGTATKTFAYTTLRIPNNYLVKVGDLILDSEAYLYQIDKIDGESCEASYCGSHFTGVGGDGGGDYRFVIADGKLQLVTESGNMVSEVDYLTPDDTIVDLDESTGIYKIIGIYTIGDKVLKIFHGTKDEYKNVSVGENEIVFPIFTDDPYVKVSDTTLTLLYAVQLPTSIAEIVKGYMNRFKLDLFNRVPKCSDGHGDIFCATCFSIDNIMCTITAEITEIVDNTYAAFKVLDVESVTHTLSADHADTADRATEVASTLGEDSKYRNVWFSDSVIEDKRAHRNSFQYNPATDTLKVGKVDGTATTATNVVATVGSANVDRHVWFGDNPNLNPNKRCYDDTFKYNPSTKTLTVKNISGNASSATKATQDGNGKNITDTYATKIALAEEVDRARNMEGLITAEVDAIVNGTHTVGVATKATQDGDGNIITDTYVKKSVENTKIFRMTDALATYATGAARFGYTLPSSYGTDRLIGVAGAIEFRDPGTNTLEKVYFSTLLQGAGLAHVIAPFTYANTTGYASGAYIEMDITISSIMVALTNIKRWVLKGETMENSNVVSLAYQSATVQNRAVTTAPYLSLYFN